MKKVIAISLGVVGVITAIFWQQSHVSGDAQDTTKPTQAAQSGATLANTVASDPALKALFAAEVHPKPDHSVGAFKLEERLLSDDVPIEDIKLNYEDWAARAQSGDSVAAFRLFQALHQCVLIDQKLSAANSQAALSSVESDLKDCAGFNEDQINKDIYKWIQLAADQGLIEAQLLYAGVGHPAVLDHGAALTDPEGVIEFKERSLSYLYSAVSSGSVDAMSQLSMVYEMGGLTDPNPVLSAAYQMAAVNTGLSSVHGDRIVQRFIERLSPDEFNRAQDLADKIYQRCCG